MASALDFIPCRRSRQRDREQTGSDSARPPQHQELCPPLWVMAIGYLSSLVRLHYTVFVVIRPWLATCSTKLVESVT